MSCVFQNLAGLQNRYPYNQWQEILGNCDVQLYLRYRKRLVCTGHTDYGAPMGNNDLPGL